MNDSSINNCSLKAGGWTRRFTACEPRLSESIELYRDSGFEVLLVNLPDKKNPDCCKNEEKYECLECFNGAEEKFRIIYTRPKNRSSQK